MKLFRWFFLVILPVTLLGLPVAAALTLLEDTPVAVKQKTATIADASLARAMGRQAVDKMLHATEPSELTFTQKDFNGLIALAMRAVARLSGTTTVNRLGLDAALTFKAPRNPIGNYVNFQFGLNPSPTGLDISQVSVGRLKIPGPMAITMMRTGINLILGNDEGTKFFNAIRSTRFTGTKMMLAFEPVPDLKGRLKKMSERLVDVRDRVAILGDPATIQIYYAKLVEIDRNFAGLSNISLSQFMGPLFQTVKDRSGFGDPIVENQAALLAMVIYFGDPRFERLTGKVRTGALKFHKPKTKSVRLAGRGDLLLHFIISAGLKIVSDSGISAAIGEFKELLDSDGGTGFSFVDLAADKAGIRFAEVATNDKQGATNLQNILAGGTTEATFFPVIKGLPEGMNEKAFNKLFGGVNSDKFEAMVQKIDNRIAEKPAYKTL